MNPLIRLMCLSAIVLLSSLAVGQASHAFLWTASGGMEDLGVVPGWIDSLGYAINRSGAVVGFDDNESGAAAFGWTNTLGMRLLNGLSRVDTSASAVNSSGQVVGYSLIESCNCFHAFLWTREGGAQDLGTLGGPGSMATGINDSGEVVGYSDTAIGVTHAFLWTQSAGMQDLANLTEKQCQACEAYALAIDNNGVIVGAASANKNIRHYPFVWRNGRFLNLGDLGGVGTNGGGVAYGVNKLGQVVGSAQTATGDGHAFLWAETTGMQDLGTLSGFTQSTAWGINSSGQVVGSCETPTGTVHAFIWSSQTGMVDLGTLGGSGAAAYAINDAGQVTGGSTIRKNQNWASPPVNGSQTHEKQNRP